MYCTRADIETKRLRYEELLALVDDEGEGEFDTRAGASPPQGNTLPVYSDETSRINKRIRGCIGEAEAVIDSALAGQYVLPIEGDIPSLLTTIAIDLSAFFLYARRRPIPDDIVKLRELADSLLKRLAKGEIVLMLPTTGQAAPHVPDGTFAVASKKRVFSDEQGL